MIAPYLDTSAQAWVLSYLLNSLWQVPLIFLAAWFAAYVLRQADVRVAHRVWVGTALLEVILPACNFQIRQWPQAIWFLLQSTWGSAAGNGSVQVAFGAVNQAKADALQLPPAFLFAVLVTYGSILAYFAGNLLWGMWKTGAIRRAAWPETRLQIPGIEVVVSPFVSGPSTIGFRRPVLLLPPALLDTASEADMDAALAHERAHVERHDFAKNLLYQALSLPIAYHPALWITRARIAETREMICDAAAASAGQGRGSYARSLLRLASMLSDQMPATNLHAIGMFDANNFERRIMNLVEKRVEMTGVRKVWIGALCGVVALTTCASALALRMNVSEPGTTATEAPKQLNVNLVVKGGIMAGQKISGGNPVYPADAKASGKTMDGTVVLDATISKDGSIDHLTVKKSLRRDYDKSAIDAVRDWHYKPYLLNGDPVSVETTINITYAIGK